MAEKTVNDDDFAKIGKEMYSTIDEHAKPITLTVTGKVPDWLEGSLLRMGPGDYFGSNSISVLFHFGFISVSISFLFLCGATGHPW